MRLQALISVNDGEPILATGSCCRTMMESAGFNPVTFRESGSLVTRWEWVRCHDGIKNVQMPPEKPKGKRIGAKTQTKLEQRFAAWSKDQ